MDTLTIPVPEAVLAAASMNTVELSTAMRSEFAVKLFREGKLSLEQCAEFCGMTIYGFLDELSRTGTPVIDYDPAELEKEIAGFPQE
jgi:predicted HTH domain antitoxin